MTWFLFLLINQAKYYAQDTGNQYSILGRLICLPDCDKTSEKRQRKRNETKSTETKRNETKSTKAKRNETKSTKWKRNKTKPTKAKRNQRKQSEITMLDYFPHMSVFHQERTGFVTIEQEYYAFIQRDPVVLTWWLLLNLETIRATSSLLKGEELK